MTKRMVTNSKACGVVSVFLVMALFASCDSRAVGAPDMAARDSAGVIIVDNPTAPTASLWRLGAKPLLELGGGTDDDLYAVTGLIRLDDSRLVVAEANSRLTIYDANGTPVSTLGGAGAGPGEFRTITWIERLPPDSVMVYDAALSRVSIFTTDGHFARSISLLSETASQAPPRLFGAFADGTMLGSRSIPAPPPPGGIGLVRPNQRLELITREGAVKDTLVSVPGDETAVLQGILAQPRFARRTHIAVDGSNFHVATSLAFELHTYDLSGGLRRIIRKPHPVLPVTDADRTTGGGRRPAFDVPEPSEFPIITGLLTDPEGRLWVEAFSKDAKAPREWFIFDDEGMLLGTAAIPVRFRPYEIGDDYILGVWRDDLDVEYVRLYPLQGEPITGTMTES